MKTARNALSKTELHEIELAIAAAEKNTSGEIVPVIATQSAHYHQANLSIGFILALITFVALWFFADIKPLSEWTTEHVLSIGWPIFVAAQVLAFFVGILLAGLIPSLKLLFISHKEMHHEVARAAREVFFNLNVGKTHSGTGVVIYISLFEHIVYVQGDHAISDKLTQEEWHRVKDLIIDDIKQNRLSDGLKKAISEMGELLAKRFPSMDNNRDELTNKVYLLD